jgi:hypothetical protein
MQPYYCSLSTYVLTGSHELCLGRWVHNAGACRICQKGVPTTPTGHTAQSTNRTWMEVKENYMNEVPEHDLVPLGRHVSLKAVLVVHVTLLLDHYVSHPELCHFLHFLVYFHIRMLMCLTFGQLCDVILSALPQSFLMHHMHVHSFLVFWLNWENAWHLDAASW